MELKCKQTAVFTGKDKDQVQKDCDLTTCSQVKACAEDRRCGKRSLVSRSKEDWDLIIGLVWCACPEQIAKTKNEAVTVSIFSRVAPRVRTARRLASKSLARV